MTLQADRPLPCELRWCVAVYRIGAVSNFLVTLPAFLAYRYYTSLLVPERPPDYPFLVWIWSGMAFLWGVMFWEISGNLIRCRRMLKYTYLEKGITSASVLVGYLSGNLPAHILVGIFLTDFIWIPLFAAAHRQVERYAGADPAES